MYLGRSSDIVKPELLFVVMDCGAMTLLDPAEERLTTF
jgi:hypothetical protein